MRLLADENIPLGSVHRLREAGHDVLAAAEAMPGADDASVLKRAAGENRILVTLDRDFGALVYHRGLPSAAGLVYLRLVPERPTEPAELLLAACQTADITLEGKFTVMDRQSVRQRPLPDARGLP